MRFLDSVTGLWSSFTGTAGALAVNIANYVLRTIEIEHANVHTKNAYSAILKGTLAPGATIVLWGRTAEAFETHLKSLQIATSSENLNVKLIENVLAPPTGSTELAVFNRNRYAEATNIGNLNVSAFPVNGIVYTNYMDANSLVLDEIDLYGAPGQGNTPATGGNLNSEWEWIVKHGVDYFFVCTNEGANTMKVTAKFFWYHIQASEV